MAQAKGTAPKITPVYPHAWREIVNGSIEEDFAAIALGTLNELIRADFVPPIEHTQLLLYLNLYPELYSIPPSQPISLLYRLLSFHAPNRFSQGIPSHPSSSSHNLRDAEVDWLEWDYKRSELHKAVWKRMRRCKTEGEGVWNLLWAGSDSEARSEVGVTGRQGENKYGAKGAASFSRTRKRNRGGLDGVDMDDEEDEAGGGKERVVSPYGWKLLEWLIELWEVDKARQETYPYSLLFLRQIPRPYGDLQRNDASSILAIVRCAYASESLSSTTPPAAAPGKSAPRADDGDVPTHELERRRKAAARLLGLLLDTTFTNKPPFHPASLSSSLIHLFRGLSIDNLRALFRHLRQSHSQSRLRSSDKSCDANHASILPQHQTQEMQSNEKRHGSDSAIMEDQRWRILAHLLVLQLEDVSGIRERKAKERRAQAKGARAQNQVRGAQKHSRGQAHDQSIIGSVIVGGKGDFETAISLDIPRLEYLFDTLLLLPLPPSVSSTHSSKTVHPGVNSDPDFTSASNASSPNTIPRGAAQRGTGPKSASTLELEVQCDKMERLLWLKMELLSLLTTHKAYGTIALNQHQSSLEAGAGEGAKAKISLTPTWWEDLDRSLLISKSNVSESASASMGGSKSGSESEGQREKIKMMGMVLKNCVKAII